jgi:hypothetical protein
VCGVPLSSWWGVPRRVIGLPVGHDVGMPDDERRNPPFRSIPRLVRLGMRLQRGYRKQLDDAGPIGLVLLNERSEALAEKVEALAGDEREDDGAVLELRQLAGRHERD